MQHAVIDKPMSTVPSRLFYGCWGTQSVLTERRDEAAAASHNDPTMLVELTIVANGTNQDVTPRQLVSTACAVAESIINARRLRQPEPEALVHPVQGLPARAS